MSEKIVYGSDRRFQLWHYTPSHSQLLLRSNKHHELKTRCELLFFAVKFMMVPSSMTGIRISLSNAEEFRHLGIDDETFNVGDRIFYKICSGSNVGLVIAGNWKVAEDELEYWEPSSILTGPIL